MGGLESCFGSPDDNPETPDPEVKRQKMLAAAERRKQVEDARGLQNPERFHEQQKKKAEMEKASAQAGGEGGLKWQVG